MRNLFSSPITLLFIAVMAFQSITGSRYSSFSEWLFYTALLLPGVIIGISFHEFGHAYVAYKCGDITPKYQGRVTLNPVAHVDLLGLCALIFLRFGWGKPVIINPGNFKKPRRDELLVALAGVTINFILAVLFMFSLKIISITNHQFFITEMGSIVIQIINQIIVINIVLMVFNLLPVPPLDGFNVITQVFNLKQTEFYYRVYDKGFFILLILIMFNITGKILTPMISGIYNILYSLFFY